MPVAVLGGRAADRRERRVVVERADRGPQPHDAEPEAEVADAVDDERLLARLRRRRPRVPEADQQVRAETDRLPEDVEQQEVAGEHQHRHREHEEVQVGEVARVARVVVHVADRVQMNEHADARHDQQHDAGERVDVRGHRRLEVARADPAEERRGERLAGGDAREQHARGDERAGQRRHRDPVRVPADEPAEDHVEQRADERKEGDQPEGGRHRVMLASAYRGVKNSGPRRQLRGAYIITETPARHRSPPITSKRSGASRATTPPHRSERTTNTPPYAA